MATSKPKVEYTKPTSQLDLEARLKAEEEGAPVFFEAVNPDESPLNSEDEAFVGVSPEYQNFANETDKPLEAESGVEKEAEQRFLDAYGDSSSEQPSDAVQEKYDEVTAGVQSTSGTSSSDTSTKDSGSTES